MKEPLRGIRLSPCDFHLIPKIKEPLRGIRLSPCDFHLIPKMKEPLRGIRLSPCDFHLIPKMKEPLRGIRFRTVPEILRTVYRSIRTMNTTGAAKGILRLPHRWQRVVHNAGEGQ